MKEEKVNSIIDKHLRGQISDDEQSQLNNWLSENNQNKVHFEQISHITQELKHIPIQLNPDTDAEWNSFLKNIADDSVEAPSSARIVQLNPMRKFLRVAAMLVLTVGLGWFIQNQLSEPTFEVAQEYVIPNGDMETVTLADGSKVYLNSGSKLSVFDQFNKKNRLLSLEGEAYFEVTKNRKLPFVIQTGDVTTEVTGTAFNLKSYKEANQILLTVTEGSVNFKTQNQLVSVEANVAASFNKKSQEINRVSFNPENDLAWREGRLIIENMTMAEGLAALERRFNVEFKNNTNLNSFRIKIKKEDTIDTVLEALKDALSIQIERKNNVITLSK